MDRHSLSTRSPADVRAERQVHRHGHSGRTQRRHGPGNLSHPGPASEFSTHSAFPDRTATVRGYLGTVEPRSVRAAFTYTPTRSFTAYAAPAVLRSARQDLEARVYRIALGARYALTPLVGIDVAYSFDSQHGAIDPLLVNG